MCTRWARWFCTFLHSIRGQYNNNSGPACLKVKHHHGHPYIGEECGVASLSCWTNEWWEIQCLKYISLFPKRRVRFQFRDMSCALMMIDALLKLNDNLGGNCGRKSRDSACKFSPRSVRCLLHRRRENWKEFLKRIPANPLKRCSPPPPQGGFFNAKLHKERGKIIHFPCIHHAPSRVMVLPTTVDRVVRVTGSELSKLRSQPSVHSSSKCVFK